MLGPPGCRQCNDQGRLGRHLGSSPLDPEQRHGRRGAGKPGDPTTHGPARQDQRATDR
jgi:hypothetical protein